MATGRVERRLAAILAADVVGYSRLVEHDEAGTLAALQELRREALDPLLAEHRGRVVKLMGDGFLAEFGSAVDAVACAAALQRAVAERQAGVPAERRIVLRVGINLGDVVVEGTATCSATGSTSPRGWSSSASPARSRSRARPTTTCTARSTGRSSTSASASSRTSRGRCASTGCARTAEPARRARP